MVKIEKHGMVGIDLKEWIDNKSIKTQPGKLALPP
jgi:hypothetical protein